MPQPGSVQYGLDMDRNTLEDDPMEPENLWLVEENRLPWDQDGTRVYVSLTGWSCGCQGLC